MHSTELELRQDDLLQNTTRSFIALLYNTMVCFQNNYCEFECSNLGNQSCVV